MLEVDEGNCRVDSLAIGADVVDPFDPFEHATRTALRVSNDQLASLDLTFL